MKKTNLYGMSLHDLVTFFHDLDQPRYRARQLFRWLYQKGCHDFDAMTDLPIELRSKLARVAELIAPAVSAKKRSADGSIKYIIEAGGPIAIESVYLTSDHGATLCISSQLGCAQGCTFCQTGRLGFIRNLTAGEIVGQVQAMVIDRELATPFNIVVMGMGEPLMNLRNLIDALDIISSGDGFGISPKRVTVSTSGHIPRLLRLLEIDHPPRIAISLNAATDEIRSRLMPVNQRWPIASIIEACRTMRLPRRERITFEYVLIGDVNDTEKDAMGLVKLLKDLRCKVNLIEFNETSDLPYRAPTPQSVTRFRAQLDRGGLTHTLRKSQGRDVGAACGQLAGKREALDTKMLP